MDVGEVNFFDSRPGVEGRAQLERENCGCGLGVALAPGTYPGGQGFFLAQQKAFSHGGWLFRTTVEDSHVARMLH